jgi:DNA-binding transcriptional LysR family regulator
MNIRFESRTPHTLLAMAEERHGVAVVPSAVRIDRSRLRTMPVVFQGKPLREPLAVFWDRRRTLPRYATSFCEMLAAYMREARPTEPKQINRPTGKRLRR